jgi:uncharacterized membrane protein
MNLDGKYISNTINMDLVLQSITNTEILVLAVLFCTVLLAGAVLYIQRSEDDDKWTSDELNDEQSNVIDYLEENDGKILQKSISDNFDWSDAKTSRITSELIDLGAVEKTRDNRQNYISINSEDREK